jgi:hypothetical protein
MFMKSVAEKRLERRKKILPKLRLKYPNALEMQNLSGLAGVAADPGFVSHIRSIILDAHLDDAALRNVLTADVKRALKKVANKSQQLRATLQALDVNAKGSAYITGKFLEYALDAFHSTVKADGSSYVRAESGGQQVFLIPDYVRLLEVLDKAAATAEQSTKPNRGPKGAGGNPAIDRFIQHLLVAAWQRRGDWTIYRATDGTWAGSLLDALKILRPYLPVDFDTAIARGRSMEHIRQKFREHIQKNRLTKNRR